MAIAAIIFGLIYILSLLSFSDEFKYYIEESFLRYLIPILSLLVFFFFAVCFIFTGPFPFFE